jgi:hypothetical protein
LFGVGLFVENEISADGHAQTARGKVEIETAFRQAASFARRFFTRPTAAPALSQ